VRIAAVTGQAAQPEASKLLPTLFRTLSLFQIVVELPPLVLAKITFLSVATLACINHSHKIRHTSNLAYMVLHTCWSSLSCTRQIAVMTSG